MDATERERWADRFRGVCRRYGKPGAEEVLIPMLFQMLKDDKLKRDKATGVLSAIMEIGHSMASLGLPAPRMLLVGRKAFDRLTLEVTDMLRHPADKSVDGEYVQVNTVAGTVEVRV